MRGVGITLAVLTIVTATRVCADGEPKRSAELHVLDRWIGDRETVVTIKTTGEKFNTTESRRWSREGPFVLSEDMNLSTTKEAHFLLTYDPNAKVYRACFIEEGNALVLLGTSDEDAQTMRWNATDAAGVKHAGPIGLSIRTIPNGRWW